MRQHLLRPAPRLVLQRGRLHHADQLRHQLLVDDGRLVGRIVAQLPGQQQRRLKEILRLAPIQPALDVLVPPRGKLPLVPPRTGGGLLYFKFGALV